MTEQTTDDTITLSGMLYDALSAMPREHRAIEAAEQAVRDHFDGELDVAERFIEQVHEDVRRDGEIRQYREALLAALADIDKALDRANAAIGRLSSNDVYDVEIAEGDAKDRIGKALDHIRLMNAAAQHYAPEAGE